MPIILKTSVQYEEYVESLNEMGAYALRMTNIVPAITSKDEEPCGFFVASTCGNGGFYELGGSPSQPVGLAVNPLVPFIGFQGL